MRPTRTPSRRGADAAAAAMRRDDSPVILGTVSIVLAMLVLVILPAITTSTVVHLLGGAAALIALVALASLVHLVVTEVRESPRRRSGPTRPARPGGRRSRMAAWLTRGRDVARGRARTLFARFHERFAGRTWRRSLLGTLAALTGASLALALVVRSPQSVPLLVGVGLTAILALRLLAAPSRGITRTAAVAAPLSVTLAVAVGRSDTPEPRRADASSAPATVRSRAAITPETRPAARGGASAAGMRADAGRVDHARDGGWLDWSTDEVHAAALDSFPASDPPSWSPLRVGAPTVTVPNMSAQA